jgi:hypothetical protein
MFNVHCDSVILYYFVLLFRGWISCGTAAVTRTVFHFKCDGRGRLPSLSTVLLQEVHRYNTLLTTVRASLDDLQKGIKGLTVMSDALEEVFESCLKNQVFINNFEG